MPFEITTAFVQQYNANITILSQQRTSRFSGLCRNETQVGELQFYDQIGAVEAQPASGRHSATPLMHTPHARRAVTTASYDWADLVDDFDMVRTLVDPTSDYTTNAVMAFNRAKDRVFMDAVFADAKTGKYGDEIVPFPAAQKVTTAGGLTVDKLIATRKLFWDNESLMNDDDEIYMGVSSTQLENLLKTTEVTSSDYNTVKALVQGTVNSFMGFRFVRSTLVPKVGGKRLCPAWVKNGMLLATGIDIKTRIGERADLRYSTQVYVVMDIGGTRMEEAKVVQVQCDE